MRNIAEFGYHALDAGLPESKKQFDIRSFDDFPKDDLGDTFDFGPFV
jgi:hypothetical protein